MQPYIWNKLPLAIYKTLDIPIFIKNKDSLYLWANDFFIQKSLGYTSLPGIYNQSDHNLSWANFADSLIENDRLVLQTKQDLSVRERVIRHDGTYVTAISKKCPVLDEQHKVIGVIGFSLGLPETSVLSALSKREYAVLILLSQGFTDKEIAKKLLISPRTVETHIIHAKHKMNVRTRAELIVIFNRN
ncbi:MAG: response regulator transcription factor [Tatlockia sp.]|nr:response regulator transcription factor [Tatlockia sp.]